MDETVQSETVETVRTVSIPEVQTDAIETTDEDYKWLTERLDAHTARLDKVMMLFETQLLANQEAARNSLEESRTLIQAQSGMIQTMSETLTGLAAASVLSRSTPNESATTLQVEEPIPETQVEPGSEPAASVAQTSEQSTRKARRRL